MAVEETRSGKIEGAVIAHNRFRMTDLILAKVESRGDF